MADETMQPEIAQGREIEVTFDTGLCIHSRFCVLQAPDVFKANTPGQWIFPDRMSAPALAAVARNCPSGAITYRAGDKRLDEADPPVNTIRLRQDGPYAVNAQIEIVGHEIEGAVRRRTLCRCGASANKPFCDGSHARIGFQATGEPETQPYDSLDPRDDLLTITPMKDGPLEVCGAAELVSGTGRTFAKTRHALLCRCGGSSAKPFCDGTHALNGFTDRTGYQRPEPPAPNVVIPNLAEWAGGRAMLKALTVAFYSKVPDDPLLAPVFAQMDRRHAEHVADFLAEVFGGPPLYSSEGGSHIGMIVKHLGREITEAQRARWVELMIETADEVGLPDDRAFRDAFVAYLEWGSKLAVINSAPGIEKPEGEWPMPKWGWGACRGPTNADA
ncbi:MAG: CDGSH iron-sulfur domain-containing protein [Sphingomonas sp.]|nr:CDGSH iron-sulfur domain-containing protein [Sphingomonas sp.]